MQVGRTILQIGLAVDSKETLVVEAIEYSLRGAADGFAPATPIVGHPTDVVVGSVVRGDELAGRADKSVRFAWNSHFDFDNLLRDGAIVRPRTARVVLRVRVRNQQTNETLTRATDEFIVDQSLVATVDGGGVGDGAVPTAASLLDPIGIDSDPAGNLFLADTGNHRIRRVTIRDGVAATIDTVVGNGFRGAVQGAVPARRASLDTPVAVVADTDGNLILAERVTASTSQLFYHERASGLVSDVLGGFGRISSLRWGVDRKLYVADEAANKVWLLDLAGVDPAVAPIVFADLQPVAELAAPCALAVADVQGVANVYCGERSSQRVLRRRGTAPPEPVAGGGTQAPAVGLDARTVAIGNPAALAADAARLFVADLANDRVLCVDATTLQIMDVITQVVVDGTPRALQQPAGLAMVGDALYVVETGENLVGSILVPGQRGHQVVVARNAMAGGAAVLVPFVGGDVTKVVAAGIGGLSTQTSVIGLVQTTNFPT